MMVIKPREELGKGIPGKELTHAKALGHVKDRRETNGPGA